MPSLNDIVFRGKPAKEKQTYRKSQAAIMKDKRSKDRDIGPAPECANPERRELCSGSFRLHCVTYHRDRFDKPFSPNHEMAIQKIEYSILHGGLFAFAMPRGEGKTTLAETAIEWGTLHGHIRFAVVIGSDKESAQDILKSIKTEIECNQLLYEDFPEVCFPIRKLDGIANRVKGQTSNGAHTHISFKSGEVIFPTVEGSTVSGTVIRALGLLGRIRGLRHTTTDGRTIRPDFVLPDDPQTDESANSDSQCARRESLIRSAVMGLAGPGQEISAVMPCTIIRKGDFVDRMLDHERNPEWRGVTTQMIVKWPDDIDYWEHEYKEVYINGLESEDEGKAANDFYLKHRERLEKGAIISWPDRKTDNDISAIQHAMNLYFKVGKHAFFAEYQNEPIPEDDNSAIVSSTELERKTNGYRRGLVPLSCQWLTMGADVHDNLIYYMLCAWDEKCSGYIVDYGTYPDQKISYFSQSGNVRNLQTLFPGMGKEAAIKAGITEIISKYNAFDFQRSNSSVIRIDRILCDAGYKPDIVHAVKREIGGATMDPSLGLGLTAANNPISSYKRKPGERHGYNWYYPTVRMTRDFPHVKFDANFWKTFVTNGLTVPSGDPGSITLFGTGKNNHRLLADHLVNSEYYVDTEGKGRKVREWKTKPGKPDNHWLDCAVLCAVAASIAGMVLPGQSESAGRSRASKTKIKLSDKQRR